MGKVVRGAHIEAERYVVRVPESVAEVAPLRSGRELDPRFAPLDLDAAFSEPAVQAAPLPEPQIDWEALAADARALIDAAAADAEAILRDAAAQAQALVAQAQERTEALESEARTRGFDDGTQAGRVKIEADLAETVANLQTVVEGARAQRDSVIEAAEPEIVRLAMAVAERVVHDHIAVDPNVVVQNVRAALTRLVGREVVTLRVNPLDLETIRAHRDAVAGSSDIERLRVVEDARVDRGGVVVETDAGTIDAKITTQLREARRALQTGEMPPAQAS